MITVIRLPAPRPAPPRFRRPGARLAARVFAALAPAWLVASVACHAPRPPAPAPRVAPSAASGAIAAAAASRSSANAAASDGRGAPLDAAERRALFDDLVAAVRKYHRFSDRTRQNLGRDWEDDRPLLEAAFLEAADDAALRDALARFGDSLHDAHLGYAPEASAGRGEHLVLPLTVAVEWGDGAARYYVAEVRDATLGARVRRGDVVLSADGVSGDRLTAVHALRSHENHWRGIARDVAAYLTSRDTLRSATKAGRTERWVLRHRGGDVEVSLTWRKEAWPGETEDGTPTDDDDDAGVEYAPAHCSRDLPDRAYPGPYRLTSHGRFYCLYTSRTPPYDAYPILRHFSVLYAPVVNVTVAPRYILPDAAWEVAAEYFSVSRALRALPRARGVILDLRDNVGGNDPEWFLDWYAPAPYVDGFTRVRVLPDFEDAAFRARVANVDDRWLAWYRGAAAHAAPGTDLLRPFACARPDCGGDNRFTPSHAVAALPVALLVGPRCASSCAHIAQIFDENDFAPLIGEPTGASFTSLRLRHPVRTRSGRDLGTIGLALSEDVSGKTGEPIEGRAVHVDYPIEETFDGADRYDRALIDAALRAFREFPFPPREVKVGP